MDSRLGKDLFVVAILICASITSFCLGRLSLKEGSSAGVTINYPNSQVAGVGEVFVSSQSGYSKSSAQTQSGSSPKAPASSSADSSSSGNEGKLIVASSRGSKYYFTWCSGAKNLSEANKIYFDTEADAEKAGYTRSTSCK